MLVNHWHTHSFRIIRGKLSVRVGDSAPNDGEAAFFETFCNLVLVLILNRKTRGCPCCYTVAV